MKMNDKNDKDSPSVVSFSLRIDTELKRQFEQFCDDVGISMTAAFTLFAKKVVREQRIPFEISADPFESEEHIKMLEKSIADLKAKKNMHQHELIED